MKCVALLTCVHLFAAGSVAAQSLSFLPYAGTYSSNPIRSFDFSKTGLLVGAQMAFSRSADRVTPTVDVGYAVINRFGRSGTAAQYVVYGMDHLLTTLGAALLISRGKRAFGVEAALGSDWIRHDAEGTHGNPPREFFPGDEFNPNFVAPLGVWSDFVIGSVSVRGAVRDYIYLENGIHALSITIGVHGRSR